jgi:hypothetical protein
MTIVPAGKIHPLVTCTGSGVTGNIVTVGSKSFELTPDDVLYNGNAENKKPIARFTYTDNNYDNDSATILLDASESNDDGNIVMYKWYSNNVLLATGINPDIKLPLGENNIKLTVIDNQNDSNSLQRHLRIKESVDPISLVFIDTENEIITGFGETPITISTKNYDFDGTVVKIEILINDSVHKILANEDETYVFNNYYTGKYYIKAVATDNNNATDTSNILILNAGILPERPQNIFADDSLICSLGMDSSVFRIKHADFANNYNWNISPSGIGDIIANDTSAIVNWKNDISGNVSISVYSENQFGTSEQTTLLLNIYHMPEIINLSNIHAPPVCNDSIITLAAECSENTDSLIWINNYSDIAVLTEESKSFANVKILEHKSFEIVAKAWNKCGTSAEMSIELMVEMAPEITNLSLADNNNKCFRPKDTIQIFADYNNAVKYTWNLSNQVDSLIFDSISAVFVTDSTINKSIFAALSIENVCGEKATDSIELFAAPTADFDYTQIDTSVYFTNLS